MTINFQQQYEFPDEGFAESDLELLEDTLPQLEDEVEARRRRRRRRRQPVTFFRCSPDDLKEIRREIGRRTTCRRLKRDVNRLARRAVIYLNKAARRLRRGKRSRRTKILFKKAFGVYPSHVPKWRISSYSWRDQGELVAIRLKKAAKILRGGYIRYYSWGRSTHCPECGLGSHPTIPHKPYPEYDACSSFKGKYTICFGAPFWQDYKRRRAINTINMIDTLMHEALHIYFSTTVAHGFVRGGVHKPAKPMLRLNNAYCYTKLALRLNGKRVPPAVAGKCP